MRRVLAGAIASIVARRLLLQAILFKLRADLARLNEGDYEPLLAGFAEDAVLHFNPGEHRWAGDHRGKAAIETFLRNFTAARLQGEVLRLWAGGPPWDMTLVIRFDDHADAPSGERIYENRTALVARTRWGRIVEQWDFYEDTGRILELERRLVELEVLPAR